LVIRNDSTPDIQHDHAQPALQFDGGIRVNSATWQRFKVADNEYGTPQELFDYYDRIYKFTCDVCATPELAKCRKFFTPDQDGLKQPWRGVCWMNPPYQNLGEWVKKAYESALQGTAVVLALLPMLSDANWFHEYASHAEIKLLKGRLQFDGGQGYTPFSHAIFIFRKRSARVGNRLTIRLDDHRIGTRPK
jgi:phage N-6-adenine-methyltransferase